ncbi:MAG TPA: hypothetical protein VJZ00_17880 [Thermoanaerobaculia bacterium]|nr:hypothetical protein [Thermoanaerobaculia bacterium]
MPCPRNALSPSFILATLFVLGAALNGRAEWPPNRAKANIGGLQGVLVYPYTGSNSDRPFAMTNCRVVLAPDEALEQRLSYPCGEWFLPAEEGAYRTWIEGDSFSSSAQILLNYVAAPYDGSGLVISSEVVPSGSIVSGTAVPAGSTLRLLNLDRPGRGFAIRVAAADAMKPIRIPPGRVVASLFDAHDNALAQSRPLQVEAGKTTRFTVEAPKKGADVQVMLRKPRGARSGQTPIQPFLTRQGARVTPEVVHEGPTWIVAMWYGVPEGDWTLKAEAPSVVLVPSSVALRAQRVVTIRRELADKSIGAGIRPN